jgi:hypothetical protein
MPRADRDLPTRSQPAEPGDHRALLRLAFLALRRDGWPGAIRRARADLRQLDRMHAGGGGQGGGYHETRLLCWLRLVGEALGRSGAVAGFDAFVAAHPELLEQARLLRHYSPARLDSPRARREFVLPDRAPLPDPLPQPGCVAAVRNGSAPGKDSLGPAGDAPSRSNRRPKSWRTPA